MKELDVYQAVWKKYLPVIAMKIKESQRKNESVSFSLYKPEFQVASKRKKISFEFDLEMRDSRVLNNSSIPPIAKDLSETLRQNLAMKQQIGIGYFKFSMNSDFILTIAVEAQTVDAV